MDLRSCKFFFFSDLLARDSGPGASPKQGGKSPAHHCPGRSHDARFPTQITRATGPIFTLPDERKAGYPVQ